MHAPTKTTRSKHRTSAADTPPASREPIEVATANERASGRSSRHKKIAVIALARRLAGVLWAMWRKHVTYEPRNINVKKASLLRRRQPMEVAAALV